MQLSMSTRFIQKVIVSLIVLSLFSCQPAVKKDIYIIPQPSSVEVQTGSFELGQNTSVDIEKPTETSQNVTAYLKTVVKSICAVDLINVSDDKSNKDAIVLQLNNDFTNHEAYHNQTVVTMMNELERHKIRYTLNGETPSIHSPVYTEPFIINEKVLINAATFKDSSRYGRVTKITSNDSETNN